MAVNNWKQRWISIRSRAVALLLLAYGYVQQRPAWNEYSRYDLVRAIVEQGTIIGTAGYVLDTLAQFPEAGIDELLIPDSFYGSGNQRFDALERLREEVLVKL